VQSDHTRQVAAVAAKLGLKAVLVQESWVDWPDAVNDKVGNALDQVRAAGGTPYPIPAFWRPAKGGTEAAGGRSAAADRVPEPLERTRRTREHR